MRQHYQWRSLAILCGLFAQTTNAADPAPLASRFTPTVYGRPGVAPVDVTSTTVKAVNSTNKTSRTTFADRVQAARQLEQQQQTAAENLPKPTQWQLQNPANSQNNLPTVMTGPIAPNNYFGAPFQQWNNLSQPAPLMQLPSNQTSVPFLNQTNVYTAPNTYYGNQFSNWSNLRSGQFEPNPFGGWNYR